MAGLIAERELNIAQYIKNHPGITKAALVRDLKGKYSRATLFNVLKNLQKQKIINVEADKVNSQIHHLFANEDNIITNQLYELEQFERDFFSLLEGVRAEVLKVYPEVMKKLDKYYNRQAVTETSTIEEIAEIVRQTEFRDITEPLILRQGMFRQCIHIFRQLLQLYTVRSIFVWPLEIKDAQRLNQITSAIFSRLVDIQLKMTKITSETLSYQDDEFKSKGIGLYSANPMSTVIRIMIDDWKRIELAQKYLEAHGLQNETRPVVELLANIQKQIQQLAS